MKDNLVWMSHPFWTQETNMQMYDDMQKYIIDMIDAGYRPVVVGVPLPKWLWELK
jgi:hypothetical protein